MSDGRTFDERVAIRMDQLSPAELEVARYFQSNREETLITSASGIASKIGTSDATVVRTVQTLGYSGLADLRRDLAEEIRSHLSPAARLKRTLETSAGTLESAFHTTLAVHVEAIDQLRHSVKPALFASVVGAIAAARRVMIFGIGPSAAIADYFAIQLGRFGVDSTAITHTGLSIADELNRIKRGDLVIVLAYGRVYLELQAVLHQVDAVHAKTVLLTDTLAPALRHRIDMILPVARGQVDAFSMHTATLALVEALLVGVAANAAKDVFASLNALNQLRAMVAGNDMELRLKRSRKSTSARGSRKPRNQASRP